MSAATDHLVTAAADLRRYLSDAGYARELHESSGRRFLIAFDAALDAARDETRATPSVPQTLDPAVRGSEG